VSHARRRHIVRPARILAGEREAIARMRAVNERDRDMGTILENVMEHEKRSAEQRVRDAVEALRGYADSLERNLKREKPELIAADARNVGQYLVDIGEAAGKLVAFKLVTDTRGE